MTHIPYPGCYCADCVEGNPSARITGDKDRENPVEGAHPMTKPEPEVDPLVGALREVLPTHNREVSKLWAANLRTALASRGGRVVFDGRDG